MTRTGHSGLTRRLRRRVMAVLAVASLAGIGMVGSAKPAEAGNGDWYRNVDAHLGLCLESDYTGRVYGWSCLDGDLQRWYQWFGGWVKNKQTGLCLTLQPGWTLATQGCDHNNRYQYWQQWDTGWMRNPYDGVCVTMQPHFYFPETGAHVYASPCGRYQNQYWDQQQW